MRWVLVGIIGMLTGITAFLINMGIHYLRQFKNETFFVGKEYAGIATVGIFVCMYVCTCVYT